MILIARQPYAWFPKWLDWLVQFNIQHTVIDWEKFMEQPRKIHLTKEKVYDIDPIWRHATALYYPIIHRPPHHDIAISQHFLAMIFFMCQQIPMQVNPVSADKLALHQYQPLYKQMVLKQAGFDVHLNFEGINDPSKCQTIVHCIHQSFWMTHQNVHVSCPEDVIVCCQKAMQILKINVAQFYLEYDEKKEAWQALHLRCQPDWSSAKCIEHHIFESLTNTLLGT